MSLCGAGYEASVPRNDPPTVVMYHDIIGSRGNTAGSSPLDYIGGSDDVSGDALREHIRYFKERAYEFIDSHVFVDVMCGRIPSVENGRRKVWLTFDDGYAGNFDTALPILAEEGVKGTFFVVPSLVGTTLIARNGAKHKDYVSWPQLRLMHAHPSAEIQSHTMSHRRLSTLDNDDLREELEWSRAVLRENLSGTFDFLAYPNGDFDARVIAFARSAGYRGAVTTKELACEEFSVPDLPLFGFPRVGIGEWILQGYYGDAVGLDGQHKRFGSLLPDAPLFATVIASFEKFFLPEAKGRMDAIARGERVTCTR